MVEGEVRRERIVMSDLLSVSDFSRLIKKSPRTVYQMIESGEIEAEDHRNPGSPRPLFRVKRSEADRWRRNRKYQPKSNRPASVTLKRMVFV